MLDNQATPPAPVINPPEWLGNGNILLSGSGPQGAVVIIYSASSPRSSYWQRDSVVVIPASGLWSIIRPGTITGHAVFYRAEFFEGTP